MRESSETLDFNFFIEKKRQTHEKANDFFSFALFYDKGNSRIQIELNKKYQICNLGDSKKQPIK